MKKWLWLLPVAVLLLFSATGCSTRGDVYLSFDWLTDPDDWSCTDPNIDDPGNPSDVLVRLQEYLTQPGNYYFEYTTGGNPWEIYYTLTAYEGSSASPPQDAKFQLFLWADKTATLSQYLGLVQPGTGHVQGTTAAPSASSTQTNASGIDRSAFVKKPMYEYTVTEGGYTLKVRGFLWEPRQ